MAALSAGPVVHIVATGAANLASVSRALRRIGAQPALTIDPREIAAARYLVLPGVGAFGSTMRRLEMLDVIDALRRRCAEGKPMLAICLGLQLLFEESEEAPGVRGLGILPGRLQRLPDGLVPHMGWNQVSPAPGCDVLEPGAAYFANSYAMLDPPSCARAAYTAHGTTTFVSAFERGGLLACQFHPELSACWGTRLLRRWLSATGADVCAPAVLDCSEGSPC